MLAGTTLIACGESRDGSIGKKETAGEHPPPEPSQWWTGGTHVDHRAVDVTRLGKGIIRARVDGEWQNFQVGQLPRRFIHWSLSRRREGLEKLSRVGFDPKDLDGPHNACVATYGGWRRDSAISLNTAYKGMGLIPRADRLEETIREVQSAKKALAPGPGESPMASMGKKVDYLSGLYRDEALFDPTAMISLELFTTTDFATHTFLNMMANPIASFSFLAFPTFEVRAIPQLLHPDNPQLTPHQKNVIAYANGIHNFVHGGDRQYMACLYHVIEVFNDSPGEADGRGKRIG